jgi:hypothetical protein
MILSKKLWVPISFLFIQFSCRNTSNKITRAFYYWHVSFNLTDSNVSYLKSIGITKLYLHFFDVSPDVKTNKLAPIAKMEFNTPPPPSFEYVPVVYITNRSLENPDADSIQTLAYHIFHGVEDIASANGIHFKELQIDCDWTETTMKKYFALLKELRINLKKENKILSATIRLHQVKYPQITGIPPVDRGMLMFYNLGSINGKVGYNSIYNPADADRYTSYISSYKLPLDVGLPIYSWTICIRNGKVVDLLQKTNSSNFSDTTYFESVGNNIFVSRYPYFLHGKYFMKNDTLKIESVNPALCKDAATNVSHYLKPEDRTVSLFEYDSLYLSSYEKQDIEKVFSAAN